MNLSKEKSKILVALIAALVACPLAFLPKIGLPIAVGLALLSFVLSVLTLKQAEEKEEKILLPLLVIVLGLVAIVLAILWAFAFNQPTDQPAGDGEEESSQIVKTAAELGRPWDLPAKAGDSEAIIEATTAQMEEDYQRTPIFYDNYKDQTKSTQYAISIQDHVSDEDSSSSSVKAKELLIKNQSDQPLDVLCYLAVVDDSGQVFSDNFSWVIVQPQASSNDIKITLPSYEEAATPYYNCQAYISIADED